MVIGLEEPQCFDDLCYVPTLIGSIETPGRIVTLFLPNPIDRDRWSLSAPSSARRSTQRLTVSKHDGSLRMAVFNAYKNTARFRRRGETCVMKTSFLHP